MDLVTVTCDRDFRQMLLQAESIQKFLDPCTHWVIVNEEGADPSKWREALSPYYTNHNLKLLTHTDFEKYMYVNWPHRPDNKWKPNGWFTQQIIKLMIHKFCMCDYLVLDTKCFFIKPTTLSMWDNITCSGTTFSGDLWQNTSLEYSKYFHTEVLPKYSMGPPFRMEYNVLNTFLFWEDIGNILYFTDNTSVLSPSEFIFYSYLEKLLDKKQVLFDESKQWIVMNTAQMDKASLYTTEDYIFGLHWTIISEVKDDINPWLTHLGFKFQF